VLACDVLSATIPGLITVDQVKNAVAAVKERLQFDAAERQRFEQFTRAMWQNLPDNYRWLQQWRWV